MRTLQPMRKTFLTCFLVTVPFTAAIAAEPAIVSKIGGKSVLMEHAGKSMPVGVQSLLSSGDRVSAGEGSYVEVEYLADGCTVRVSSGHSMVIGQSSPCAAAAVTEAPKPVNAKALPKDANIVPAEAPPETVQVTDASGPITRVNRGDGLADLKPGAGLTAGDAVYAGKGSTITLTFASGCVHVVPETTFFTIPAAAPCSTAQIVPAATDNDSENNQLPTEAVIATTAVVVGASALAFIGSRGAFDGDNNGNGNGVGEPATQD